MTSELPCKFVQNQRKLRIVNDDAYGPSRGQSAYTVSMRKVFHTSWEISLNNVAITGVYVIRIRLEEPLSCLWPLLNTQSMSSNINWRVTFMLPAAMIDELCLHKIIYFSEFSLWCILIIDQGVSFMNSDIFAAAFNGTPLATKKCLQKSPEDG